MKCPIRLGVGVLKVEYPKNAGGPMTTSLTHRGPDHATIHAFSAAAAGVGAGLAQLPGSDAPVLVSLQTAMITQLAINHDRPMTEMATTELVLTLSATMAGRAISQWLVGWWPGWGNALNASTAAALTESMGWAAVAWFERGEA